ncbi:Predicted membrane protein [Chryseobacterium oranimense]|uniref:Predicted membrane protein n=1 Tax=Chryseobacterium oranimense TaxID=421058 RepID=A0A1M5PXS2_9FLAO|nr:Predicted membrane protein [Chryseobacterium oranimense]
MLTAKKHISFFLKSLLIAGFGYFFWLMLKITLEYIPFNPNVSFLMIKQTEVQDRPEYLYFFYTHVYTSIFVLFSGFLAILRKDFGFKNFHKNMGKIYIFLILALAAPSGVYMGFFANGGFFSKISFVILGSFWWLTTYKAYQSAKQKRFKEHKQWMWRSFALTLSALTLRIWKVIIVYLFHPNPMDVYQIIAWLGWIPNILLIEYLITKKHI